MYFGLRETRSGVDLSYGSVVDEKIYNKEIGD